MENAPPCDLYGLELMMPMGGTAESEELWILLQTLRLFGGVRSDEQPDVDDPTLISHRLTRGVNLTLYTLDKMNSMSSS